MQYRKHQQEIDQWLSTVSTTGLTSLLAHVTPGGGKSLLPQIAYSRLRAANLVDKVCAIVPRENLQTQMALDFQCPRQRALVGHQYRVNEATNQVDPSRGLNGYVTSYQAIGLDAAGINAAEFQRYRYLLVLDEIHHVVEGGRWHRQLQALVDLAAFSLMMTGSLERGDRAPIAFLPYEEIDHVEDQ